MASSSKGARTQQRIAAQAAPLFNSKGYAGTSLQDILQATGLTKGGVYASFESKEQLAVAAFQHATTQLQAALQQATSAHSSPVAKLLAILHFYHNYTLNPPVAGGCPLLNAGVEADDAYPFLHTLAKQALQHMLGSLQRLFESAVAVGELPPTLNCPAEAELFFAQVEGGIFMAQALDDPEVLNRILQQLHARLQSLSLIQQ